MWVLFLAVSLALAPGTPTPRAVAIGEGVCRAMLSGVRGAPSAPGGDCGEVPICDAVRGCPARSACDGGPAPAAESGTVPCESCVCSACCVGIPSPGPTISEPLTDSRRFEIVSRTWDSVSLEPSLPPPKA
jgi:hypothetical protein